MNTDQAVDRLRSRAATATRGPWVWETYGGVPQLMGRGGDPDVYDFETEVIEVAHHGECGCRSACSLELNARTEDREYVASMHPGIGTRLADLLDAAAQSSDPHARAAAARFADAYLAGETSGPVRTPDTQPVLIAETDPGVLTPRRTNGDI